MLYSVLSLTSPYWIQLFILIASAIKTNSSFLFELTQQREFLLTTLSLMMQILWSVSVALVELQVLSIFTFQHNLLLVFTYFLHSVLSLTNPYWIQLCIWIATAIRTSWYWSFLAFIFINYLLHSVLRLNYPILFAFSFYLNG